MNEQNVEVSVKLIDGSESFSYEYYASCAPRENEILNFDVKEHDIHGFYMVRQVCHRIFDSLNDKRQMHYVSVRAYKVSNIEF